MAAHILIIDDDDFMRTLLADVLAAQGWNVLAAGSGEEGLAVLARESVQVILCDQCMPGMSGAELLAQAREMYPAVSRIILSGQAEQGEIAQALQAGVAQRYCAKPWSAPQLAQMVHEALAQQRAHQPL